MSRPDLKKESKGKKEEKYPCSPRSQKWIGNLLPVLESYNYNHAEIVKLVKSCDYDANKIQAEVERIVQMKHGHEQGEWELVKPNSKEKPKGQNWSQSNGGVNGKFRGKVYSKDEKNKRGGKGSPKTRPEQKPEGEDKKELFTSWASLLKKDSSTTNGNNSGLLSGSTGLIAGNLMSGGNGNYGSKEEEEEKKYELLGQGELESNLVGDRLNESLVVGGGGERLSENIGESKLNENMGETKKDKPAVIMPKEFNYSESKLTFGCLEDDGWGKPWPEWNRGFPKQRSGRSNYEVFPNYYERKFYYEDPSLKKYDFPPTSSSNPGFASNTPGYSSNNPAYSSNNPGFTSSTNNPGFTGSNPNFGNSAQGFGSTAQNFGNNLESSGLGNSDSNRVYFNYPYSNERLQNPPGLVSYYTPQPFYAFGSGSSSSNNVSSMWQN